MTDYVAKHGSGGEAFARAAPCRERQYTAILIAFYEPWSPDTFLNHE